MTNIGEEVIVEAPTLLAIHHLRVSLAGAEAVVGQPAIVTIGIETGNGTANRAKSSFERETVLNFDHPATADASGVQLLLFMTIQAHGKN